MSLEANKPKKKIGKRITFERVFGATRWDDPSVSDKLRKLALAISHEVMRGKEVPEAQRKTAEFVLGRFVASNAPTTVHLHLTEKMIEEAKRRAGLLPPLTVVQTKTGQSKP